MKVVLFYSLVIAVLNFGCQEQSSKIKGVIDVDYSPVSTAPEDAIFKLLDSDHTNIVFDNFIRDLPEHNINTYDYFYNGGGVAIGDINNDGLSDIFFTGNMVPNRLYLNKGDLVFEDITSVSGLYTAEYWSTGVNMMDINNDGWLDIYICNSGPWGFIKSRQNLLYINNQDGTFREAAFEFGLVDNSFSSQATMLDYDLDGDLDLYVMNHTDFNKRFKSHRNISKRMSAISKFMSQEESKGVFNNILFKRRSDGMFERENNNILSKQWGYGLGVVASDINNDSHPDLYVANDFVKPDFVYINNGQGGFQQENKKSLGHNSQFSMGVDIADINNDGWMDIGVVDMVSAERVRNKVLMAAMNEGVFRFVTEKIGFQEQYMFNVVQLNNGNGTFSEIGHLLGTTQTDWSWSSLFADFDLDGDKDYLITNGFRRDTKHRDIQTKVEETKRSDKSDDINIVENLNHYPSVPLVNYLFENKGNYSFENVSKQWGFVHPSFSNGAAYGDLDNDGDLDLVVNNIDREAFVYQNTTIENHSPKFLKISFDKDPRNYNAKITVITDSASQYLEFNPTRGYLSSMDHVVTFGLGKDNIVNKVVVKFLYGRELIFDNVQSNQTLIVSINNDNVVDSKDKNSSNNHLFTPVSEKSLATYKHQENNHWDFTKEVLLPHKQSYNGPHISVGDINGDHLQDMFIGGAKNSPGAIFIQSSGSTLLKSDQVDILSDSIYEDLGSIFLDYDNDGDQDLYVVSGGGGDVTSQDLWKDRLYVNNGSGKFTKSKNHLPNKFSSGMRVKSHDYDNDGDLDLFVGGRVVPGKYPMSPQSQLLNNENGTFRDVTTQVAPDLSEIGMVTDFQWVDINADGAIDLIVLGEWMNIEVFEQVNGRFEKATSKYFEESQRGWWFSLAAKDMDGDGDIDLIAGNLGLNNKFHASPKKPLEIFFNDFDDNGSYDIVLAKTDDRGNNYAVRGKDCSTSQMPFIKDKYPKYEDFATASLDEVYTKEKLDQSLHYSISDFSSAYFENVDGSFIRHQLPIQAQFAPIQDILIDDFDGDGLLDAVVAGNLFDTEIETTSYDAGTGVFLKGDGKGHFKALAVHESGLYLGKNLKDMAIIKIGDKRYIIGANNDDHVDLIRIND